MDKGKRIKRIGTENYDKEKRNIESDKEKRNIESDKEKQNRESDKEKWNRKADISNERETDIRNVRYTISGRA